MVQAGEYALFNSGEESVLFGSEVSSETETEEAFQALTIEDFNLGKLAAVGMKLGGAGLVVSLLVLGILSLIRMR